MTLHRAKHRAPWSDRYNADLRAKDNRIVLREALGLYDPALKLPTRTRWHDRMEAIMAGKIPAA